MAVQTNAAPAPVDGAWERLRSKVHPLPGFVIIGTQRGGTTSLFNYLVEHPRVVGLKRREVHFFDQHYERGVDWYRRQFPAVWRTAGRQAVTGESTPYYLFDARVPERLRDALPHAKLIVLLRDPVQRAISQYQLMRKKGREELTFEDAIAAEKDRLECERQNGSLDAQFQGEHHFYHSYLARGIYADQLDRWFALFPRKQIHIIQSEQMYSDTARVVAGTVDFLELEMPAAWESRRYEQFNATESAPIAEPVRARLAAFFRPHNERLFAMLGRKFDWMLRAIVPFVIDMLDGHCDLLDCLGGALA